MAFTAFYILNLHYSICLDIILYIFVPNGTEVLFSDIGDIAKLVMFGNIFVFIGAFAVEIVDVSVSIPEIMLLDF